MITISPSGVIIGLGATIIIFMFVGSWIARFRMSQTIRRTLGRKPSEKDLGSISTWMQVDEKAEKNHEIRPCAPMAAGQAVPPAVMTKISSPVKILFAIGLILLTLYGEHLIPPRSVWDTYQGHRLVDAPLVIGVVLLCFEWKRRRRFSS